MISSGPNFREHLQASSARARMGFCPLLLRVRGQLTAAQEDTARPRTLGSEDIFCLRGKFFRQKGIHDGDDIAQLIPVI